MSVFSSTSHLEVGDCALILRADGTFQIASHIAPDGESVTKQELQHMLLILGLYVMANDPAAIGPITGLGASPEGQAIAAQAAPTQH